MWRSLLQNRKHCTFFEKGSEMNILFREKTSTKNKAHSNFVKKYFKIFCWLIFYILFLLKIAAAGKSLNYCSVVTYDFRVRQKNAILKVRDDHCDFSTNPNCDLWSLSKSKATDGGALKSPPWSCPFSENIIKLWVVRAVVVAQLLQRSLPTLEIRTLNPAIGKNIERLLSTE